MSAERDGETQETEEQRREREERDAMTPGTDAYRRRVESFGQKRLELDDVAA